MCAPNILYDKCLSYHYHISSLSNFLSYLVFILSCVPNRPFKDYGKLCSIKDESVGTSSYVY